MWTRRTVQLRQLLLDVHIPLANMSKITKSFNTLDSETQERVWEIIKTRTQTSAEQNIKVDKMSIEEIVNDATKGIIVDSDNDTQKFTDGIPA